MKWAIWAVLMGTKALVVAGVVYLAALGAIAALALLCRQP